MNKYFSLPFTLFITTSGAGISVGNGINSNKNIQHLSSSKLSEINTPLKVKKEKEKELIKEDKSKDNPKVVKKSEDFVGEFIFFNEEGKKTCGAGDGQGTRWREKKKDCSTEGMKKYSAQKDNLPKVFLKLKDGAQLQQSGVGQFIRKSIGEVEKIGGTYDCQLPFKDNSNLKEGAILICTKQ